MALYLVSYDLHGEKDYKDLYTQLEKFTESLNCLRSVWIIKSTKTTEQVLDILEQHIDDDDELIVTELTGQISYSSGFKKAVDIELIRH